MGILDRALNVGEGKKFKQYEKRVARINAFEPELELEPTTSCASAWTRCASAPRRRRESLDDARCRDVRDHPRGRRRTMGMRHFDVQLIGGMVLHGGNIAEMKTGEGKTLTATLAVVPQRAGRQGRPRRHGQRLPRPPRRRVDEPDLRRRSASPRACCRTCSRREDKHARLRRRHHLRHELRVRLRLPARQHGARRWRRRSSTAGAREDGTPLATHNFAIVDEVDNILIDEARTPLIISGAPEQAADFYVKFAQARATMEPGKKPEGMDPRTKKDFVADFDFEFDEKHKTVVGHRAGRREGRALPGHRPPLPRRERPPRQPPDPGAEGRVALQARRGLRRHRRRGEDHRRVHRPHPRGPALVGGPAPGRRGQGGRARPGGEPDARARSRCRTTSASTTSSRA